MHKVHMYLDYKNIPIQGSFFSITLKFKNIGLEKFPGAKIKEVSLRMPVKLGIISTFKLSENIKPLEPGEEVELVTEELTTLMSEHCIFRMVATANDLSDIEFYVTGPSEKDEKQANLNEIFTGTYIISKEAEGRRKNNLWSFFFSIVAIGASIFSLYISNQNLEYVKKESSENNILYSKLIYTLNEISGSTRELNIKTELQKILKELRYKNKQTQSGKN